MLPATSKSNLQTRSKPCVLIVDDEPALIEMIGDIVGKAINCRLIVAGDLQEAERLMRSEEKIELLVADVHLPDGRGIDLLPSLRTTQPDAGAVIITGDRSVLGAVQALRAGAMDFLPKPFTAEDLIERIQLALQRQRTQARETRRAARLKKAVQRLKESRRTVSRKVDLLCNDLITAYGELSKQMDEVRVGAAFARMLDDANDLEQLLCHTMDWLLRRVGYCNVAIWLASEEAEFELGAYMKYTIPGEPALTDPMRRGLLRRVLRDGSVRMSAQEIATQLSKAEAQQLRDQNILAINCTYLGEPLAAFVLFRDQKAPFTDDDASLLQKIAPLFSVALAGAVRRADDDEEEDNDSNTIDEQPRPKKEKRSADDWWKNGEPPPF